MDVRHFDLLPGDVTVVEALPEGREPWGFAPFDDQCAVINLVDDRFIVALGKARGRRLPRVGVFDVEERTVVATVQSAAFQYLSGFAFSSKHRAVFIPDSSGERLDDTPSALLRDGLRRIDVDTGIHRFIPLAPGFFISDIVARSDGAIVCNGNGERIAVLHPEDDSVEVSEATGFIRTFQKSQTVFKLRWFSPDGYWALRAHLGSVVTHDPSLLERLFPGRAKAVHPDLAGIKGRAYGVSLDLYRLDPFRHRRRLVLRYQPTPSPSLGRVLDYYADRQDWRTWDGRSQLFFTEEMTAEDRKKYQIRKSPEQAAVSFLTGVEAVTWDADSLGFVATFTDGQTRHVTIDGQMGPLQPAVPEPKYVMGSLTPRPLPSEQAISRVRRDIADRATVRVPLHEASPAGLATAVSEMADRMEAGLADLVFNDAVQFVVVDGRRRLNDKRFFDLVRALPAEERQAIIPPLRRLLESYGRQVAQRDSIIPIKSGFTGETAEHAALSQAALMLAQLDPRSFEVLRGWFESVDQEHDYFAAEKVLPAIRKRVGFDDLATVRFGLWFLMYQWQTTSYALSKLGIIEAARGLFDPPSFAAAVTEEAQKFSSFDGFKDSDTSDVEHRIGIIVSILDVVRPWDQAASQMLVKPAFA